MTTASFGYVSADILADLYWEYGDRFEAVEEQEEEEEDEPEFDDV